MQRVCYFVIICLVCFGQSVLAAADDNSTPAISKPAQDQTEGTSSAVIGKFPLDIQSKGTDQSGTLLSYKLKEEVVASKLFELTASEKKKFVMHMLTQAEFPDRPSIASQYSIVLVYQEDSGNLTYYLNHLQGQVHAEGVKAEMQKILEWTHSTLKKFNYLLEE
jgi:hypothetical protein